MKKIAQEDFGTVLEMIVMGLRSISEVEVGQTYTFSMDITIKDDKYSLVNQVCLKEKIDK